jgi:hypothetical protein
MDILFGGLEASPPGILKFFLWIFSDKIVGIFYKLKS